MGKLHIFKIRLDLCCFHAFKIQIALFLPLWLQDFSGRDSIFQSCLDCRFGERKKNRERKYEQNFSLPSDVTGCTVMLCKTKTRDELKRNQIKIDTKNEVMSCFKMNIQQHGFLRHYPASYQFPLEPVQPLFFFNLMNSRDVKSRSCSCNVHVRVKWKLIL